MSDDGYPVLPADPNLYTWSPTGSDIEIPLPKQPEGLVVEANGTKSFSLQRPTPEEIGQITDPYGEALRARLLVLNRWTHNTVVEIDGRHRRVPVRGVWGPYAIHGEGKPSLFKTWHRARNQALGGADDPKRDRARGPRPGAILLFDLKAMPCVTSEDEMRTAMARPYASRCWDKESEHEFAERMAQEWMVYAAQVKE